MARVDNRGNLRGSLQNMGATSNLTVRGAEEFLALSKRLKAAGETGLRKELSRAVAQAAKPLIPKIRQSARSKAPTHGGLNERLARKPYRAQARTGARTAGARITGSKVDPRMNATGRIAHPVFGRPKSTVVQNVPDLAGYFDEPLQESAPQVREDIVRVVREFADRIAKG